jgi:hypothetical protein
MNNFGPDSIARTKWPFFRWRKKVPAEKPDQLRFVLLKNHSIYSKSIKEQKFASPEGEAVKKLKNRDFCACKLLILKGPQNTNINFFTPSGGLPPLNVEFAQHYLQCKSETSCFPSEILSPPNGFYS